MTGEQEMFVAAFFRTIGKDVATTDEFIMETSLGQKWMTPSEAKTLLTSLVSSGALELKDGYIRPKPDISNIDVPLAYRPPKGLASMCQTSKRTSVSNPPKQGDDVFPKLMEVAVENGLQRREFIQESNRIQKRLDIDIGAAALIVLRDADIDIAPYIDPVYDWVKESGITPS